MADPDKGKQIVHAATLLAHGELSDEEIAEEVGVSRRTIFNWKQKPAFAALVSKTRAEVLEALRNRAISQVEQRINRNNRDWLKLQRVIKERSEDPIMRYVPGGKTGMIVRDLKTVGKGNDAQTVEVYSVDTALLRELRELEKHAATDLGQWIDKAEVKDTTTVAEAWVEAGKVMGQVSEGEDDDDEPAPEDHRGSEG